MVHVNFIGDVALFREYQRRNIDPFRKVKLPDSNLNVANFEFVIGDNRKKFFYDVPSEYAVDYHYFKNLKLDLFHVYGLSNNHIMDYGHEGVRDIQKVFQEKNIDFFGFGTEGFNVYKTEINNISIALIAFVKKGRWSRTEKGNPGPDGYDVPQLLEQIYSLKQEVDHLFIYPHWGTELVDVPMPEDIINARKFIDAGASGVIGHHAHIIQGLEYYKGKPIAYSLGSFIYLPEKELGYKKTQGQNRNYSICLQLQLTKEEIIQTRPFFYCYNTSSFLPDPIEDTLVKDYFQELNDAIGDVKIYRKKVRKLLLKRELTSFKQRFRKAPLKALRHYIGYLRKMPLKKLINVFRR